MTLQTDKRVLTLQLSRYMTLLSNLAEPPVKLLSDLDYFRGLVEFANQGEIKGLQATWGQIKPTDLRSRRYIETGKLLNGAGDKPMGKADLTPQPMVYKAGQHTGAMLALFVPPDLARAIAVPGGEEPSELHCTLAYLGKAADLDGDEVDSLKVVCAAAAHVYAPLQGFINGAGIFVVPDGEKDPIYLIPDVSALPEFRQRLIDHLADFYIHPASDHGYSPHITMRYIDRSERPEIVRPPRLPITFSHISLVLAGQRYDWPFVGSKPDLGLTERAAKKYPGGEKRRAHELVENALKRGDIKRPGECELCGTHCKTQAHHYAGYSDEDALKIWWVCNGCNGRLARKIGLSKADARRLVQQAELEEKAGARHTGKEYGVIQEGHDLFVGLGAGCEGNGKVMRAGARHSAADRKMIQRAHDIACELGADCQAQPMTHKAQTDAPNYKAASTPQRCENCTFYNPDNYGQCRRFNFAADPDYVCDDWQAMKPNEIPGYKPQAKGDLNDLLRTTQAILIKRKREGK